MSLIPTDDERKPLSLGLAIIVLIAFIAILGSIVGIILAGREEALFRLIAIIGSVAGVGGALGLQVQKLGRRLEPIHKNAQTAVQQTNGNLDQRIENAITTALDRQRAAYERRETSSKP